MALYMHMNAFQLLPGHIPSVPRAQPTLPGTQPGAAIQDYGEWTDTPSNSIQEHGSAGIVDNKFACICGKTISEKSNFTRHCRENKQKAEGTSVKCPHCNIEKTRPGNLINHVKSLHPNEYHAKCNICGRWFYQAADLARHSNHPKGCSIRCGICGATFMNPDDYEQHMRRKHPKP
ncbi:hypothetical protein H2200_007413 [Cladophialophora chaetospira]|uniref:C2H2-type domain-containing protein n=1 Tax=Cladophialophora chaetospira TaxID=386627 RepID=A0AA39CHP4_9EURO|nr:hypothetical protein H2200_007413 [Cladophialophora chaetospira]